METDIVGTIAFNPNDDRMLIYNIDTDTLPENTLTAVNSVINPAVKGPYNSGTLTNHGLPSPVAGQRYLIVEDLGSETSAWGQIYQYINNSKTPVNQAYANDIIEYDGSDWVIDFDSTESVNIEYVTNLTTGIQYRWADKIWMKSYEGWYDEGDYSIVI